MREREDGLGPDDQIQVAIVPHTHWDREWYAPFQTYRLRLVRLLDGLLPALETDAGFAHFCLDGQTAVVDDYLAVRPEAEERLARLASSGRISIGPWAILMDEFMVSGETIVRNLQAGRARARQLVGASATTVDGAGAPVDTAMSRQAKSHGHSAFMPVGYLPDMFGHVAQMPQILRLVGLEHAVVWRGVPAVVADRTAFWWEAPDGSRVRAEYLYGSYSNGRDLPGDGAGLVERARDYEAEVGAARLAGGGLLLLNGTDHHLPQPWVGQAAAEANAAQDRYRFTVTSLAGYLAAQPDAGLATWSGELRSGARSNLLMGVTSNRIDVKRVSAAAERAVERRAEPLLALFRPVAEWDSSTALLDVAWSRLVLNSAHDSSCACSHDEVVDQVAVRYHEARQVAEGLAGEALAAMASETEGEPGDLLVVNPGAHRRESLVETFVPGEGAVHFVTPDGSARPTQTVGVSEQRLFEATVAGDGVAWILDMMRGREFAGRLIRGWTATDGQVVLRTAWPGEAGVDLSPLRELLGRFAGTGTPITVTSVDGPLTHLLVATGPVAGFGWTTLTARAGTVPTTPGGATAGVRDGIASAANELVRVDVDPADGTFTLTDLGRGRSVSGLGRYVDGGDGGDTYNYSPPAVDSLVDSPTSVVVAVTETGPLRARLAVTSTYRWPAHAEGNERCTDARSEATVEVALRTMLEVRAGDPVVGVEVAFDNPARDHRLRVHFPLPAPVAGSDAECAFAVVHRGLGAEGGPGEAALPTFPARRFVDCSDGTVGLAVVSDSLLEYEVLGEGRELAVTVLRAVGYLSRLQPRLRPNAAGPPVPVTGAQMPGPQLRRYGLVLHQGDWRAAALYRRADEFTVPLEQARLPGGAAASGPPEGQMLRVGGVGGAEVSAVCREGGALVVRLYNPAPEPVTVTVTHPRLGPVGGEVVDLGGDLLRVWRGEVLLRAGEIATLRLDFPGEP